MDSSNKKHERKNPIKDYYTSLRSQKNFMKSLFIKSFVGRYKNTYLGFLWNFISPLIYIILLYIISTEIRGRDPEWMIMIISGVAAYQILLSGVTSGTGYFTGGASMIKKMYFPREILVYVQVLIRIIVSLIIYAIVPILMALFGRPFNPVALLYFPLIMFLIALFTIGCSLLLSSITVYVRDIQHAITSITMIFFVTTPLRGSIYDFSGMRGSLMWCNPFSYYIEPMHQIFYFGALPDSGMILVASMLSIIFLLLGIAAFSILKHGFVERL